MPGTSLKLSAMLDWDRDESEDHEMKRYLGSGKTFSNTLLTLLILEKLGYNKRGPA